MKIYIAAGAVLLTLVGLVGLQSHRLEKAHEKNGKLEQTVRQREVEYNALKEAADNQLLARDAALKQYKISVTNAERANKKLAKALAEAAKDDEKFNQCMRIVVSDAVFNQLPE